jgi:hypothetical protein
METSMLKSRVLIAAAILCSMIGMSAQAFTYDNRTNQNPDGSARFTDPEGAAAKKLGSHFSMHFSGGSTNGQSGYDNRFVPSANGVFASPFDSQNNFDTALGPRH